MILVDSSAWVEFLRGTRSRVCEGLDRLLDADIAITDPIVMEVLAGARHGRHLHELRAWLGWTQMARCGPRDFDAAALLYWRCRSSGETVRRLKDCLRPWPSGRSSPYFTPTPTSRCSPGTRNWCFTPPSSDHVRQALPSVR